jgi:hypothetical protein
MQRPTSTITNEPNPLSQQALAARRATPPRTHHHTEFVLVVGMCAIVALGYVAYSMLMARQQAERVMAYQPNVAPTARAAEQAAAQSVSRPIAKPIATTIPAERSANAQPVATAAPIQTPQPTLAPADLSAPTDASLVTNLGALGQQPFALVRASGPRDGVRIDVLTLDSSTHLPTSRRASPIRCERVYYAGGRIACARLENDSSHWHINLYFYSQDFKEVFKTEVPGATISRVRVSADGRFGAMTNFVVGHSYNDEFGGFSTATHIVDVDNQKLLTSLETWPLLHNGERVFAIDLNLWGVTFVPDDSDRFYATARYNRKNYLVEGRISTKQMTVIYDNVECPSISPDGSRIAFKHAVPGFGWVPAILDLKTQQRTTLDEATSLDDQIAWLDNTQIAYELRSGTSSAVMVRDARHNTPSRLWVSNASSPAAFWP